MEINHFDEMIKIIYNYNGINYAEEASFYSSNYNIGDIVKISLNPSNPRYFYIHDMIILIIVFSIIGVLFLLISLILYFISKYKNSLVSKCLEYGYKKTLDVIEIKQSYSNNNRNKYYYLVVLYENKKYKSDLFTINKNFNLKEFGVVDVYFLEDGKYYIKLDSYRKKEIQEC